MTRQDLQDKISSEVKFSCKGCGTKNSVHVNRVFASSSKLSVIICTLIGCLFLIAGFFIFSWEAFAVGGFIITTGLVSNLNSTATAFNKTFVN